MSWLVVTGQGRVILGVYGPALWWMAEHRRKGAQLSSGHPAFVEEVEGDKPSVGRALGRRQASRTFINCSPEGSLFGEFTRAGLFHVLRQDGSGVIGYWSVENGSEADGSPSLLVFEEFSGELTAAEHNELCGLAREPLGADSFQPRLS